MSNPTEQDISRVVSGYNRAAEAIVYGESIVCEMHLIENDNYIMIWSTEYNGPFVPNN